jgi:hypothetical protein
LTIELFSHRTNGEKIYGTFWIDFKKNPDFIYVDFKDELEIYDKENKLIFRGLVKNYQYTDKYGIIEARDISLIMEHVKITVEFIEMNKIDPFSILAKMQGFEFNPGEIPYNTNSRDFLIILPVQNLIINEPFTIGDVEFYQDFNNFDDSLIRKSDTGRKDSLWNGNFSRARVTIKAKNFFDAIIEGYNTVSRAIDIISLRTDISFPSNIIGDCQYKFHFSYHNFLSKVKIPTIVYCREKDSRARTFLDIESIRENVLSINVESQKFFEEIIILCNTLISKVELSKEKKNYLQVLHWLRRSIQEGNNKDKFIDLWIAFEFLISGEKTESVFTDDDKTTLRNMIDFTKFNENQQQAVTSKINMMNDSPQMEKFNHLVDRLKIGFSEEELITFKKLRDKRSDLIHGKQDVLVVDYELNKMRTILEKLFIGKLNPSKCDNL